MSHIVLRPAAPDDRAAVERLLVATDLPTEDLPPSLVHFFVALDGDQLVGVAGLERRGEAALLRSFAVVPAQRGRGIAGRLYRALLDEAARLDLHDAYLLTTTAQALFQHWGFSVVPWDKAPPAVRETPQFQGLCPSSAACLHRPLTAVRA